jgi:hypothetical protein
LILACFAGRPHLCLFFLLVWGFADEGNFGIASYIFVRFALIKGLAAVILKLPSAQVGQLVGVQRACARPGRFGGEAAQANQKE